MKREEEGEKSVEQERKERKNFLRVKLKKKKKKKKKTVYKKTTFIRFINFRFCETSPRARGAVPTLSDPAPMRILPTMAALA